MTPSPAPPPHAAMMQILMGQLIAGCVSGLARLGIPDVVASGPKSAGEVAREIGADPDAVYRLMRATAAVGVLSEGADGKFSQTPLSAVLCSDAQPGLRQMAVFMTEEYHVRGWSRIGESVRTGKTVMEGMSVVSGYKSSRLNWLENRSDFSWE